MSLAHETEANDTDANHVVLLFEGLTEKEAGLDVTS